MPWFAEMSEAIIKTGDQELTENTIAMLRDFIEEYHYQPRPNGELNAGLGRLPNLCKYLPYLFDAEDMTPRDCVEILKFLAKEGEYMWMNPSKRRRDNLDNMGMAITAALIRLSVTFPELAESKVWLEDACGRLDHLMDHLVMKDGAYTEHTMGYPVMMLNMMMDLSEFCRERNTFLPEKIEGKTHQLARYLMNVSMPDGYPPSWGEGGPANSKSALRRAAEYFDDAELRWWCGLTEEPHVPGYTSVHYPEAKIAVFRSGWDENALTLFFAPRVGGGHYHVDQNHISLYGYGRKLLVDTGMSSYSGAHPHYDWQRHQGKSHNSVEVDGKGFPRLELGRGGGRGSNIGFENLSKSELFVGEKIEFASGYAAGYPNVPHFRDIICLKQVGVFVVADVLKPSDGKSHIYDQCWHLSPDLDFEVDEHTSKVSSLNENGANIDIIPLYPEHPDSLVRKGYNAHPLGDTQYPAFRQKKEGDVIFLTLLHPRKNKNDAIECRAEVANRIAVIHFESKQGRGLCLLGLNGNTDLRYQDIYARARFVYVHFDAENKFEFAAAVEGSELVLKGEAIKFEELKAQP
jgi:hypothetical protein